MKIRSGFTLIELMMVILIIGILAALAIPRFVRASAEARKKEALRVLKQILILEEAYYMEQGHYQASTGVNEIPHISWQLPSMKMRYNYTVQAGLTGSIQTSLLCVATEIHDADLDGILNEKVFLDENGFFLGDYHYD